MIDLEQIGYFLFMEQQERQEIKLKHQEQAYNSKGVIALIRRRYE